MILLLEPLSFLLYITVLLASLKEFLVFGQEIYSRLYNGSRFYEKSDII